tara:strand:- start:33 stop:194 length:162 start_codon:yes stop_codon:yes gene_type:complete
MGGGPPRIRLWLNAKLVSIPQREFLATETLEFLEAMVSTFNIALVKTIKLIAN